MYQEQTSAVSEFSLSQWFSTQTDSIPGMVLTRITFSKMVTNTWESSKQSSPSCRPGIHCSLKLCNTLCLYVKQLDSRFI